MVSIIACETKHNEVNTLAYKQSLLLTKTDIAPPKAEAIPEQLIIHNDTRTDNYYWMKLSDKQKVAATPDEQTTNVVAYLNAENEYREKMMSHTETFENTLFEELKGRIKQTDMSVPFHPSNPPGRVGIFPTTSKISPVVACEVCSIFFADPSK
ncbi:MAG: hypothetical protein WD426_20945 [Anditalea sp.]